MTSLDSHMHTESWDALADAVLTHDPEMQHEAWTPDVESWVDDSRIQEWRDEDRSHREKVT